MIYKDQEITPYFDWNILKDSYLSGLYIGIKSPLILRVVIAYREKEYYFSEGDNGPFEVRIIIEDITNKFGRPSDKVFRKSFDSKEEALEWMEFAKKSWPVIVDLDQMESAL